MKRPMSGVAVIPIVPGSDAPAQMLGFGDLPRHVHANPALEMFESGLLPVCDDRMTAPDRLRIA